jgi:hypothetical protein
MLKRIWAQYIRPTLYLHEIHFVLKWHPGKTCLPKFQVKNRHLSESTLGNNLDLIKLPSEQLVAFNEVVLCCRNIGGVRDEAAFLFTRLEKLRIRAVRNDETLQIKKTIEDFQKVRQLEFIALEFPLIRDLYPEIMGREMLTQINSLSLSTMKTNGLEFRNFF